MGFLKTKCFNRVTFIQIRNLRKNWSAKWNFRRHMTFQKRHFGAKAPQLTTLNLTFFDFVLWFLVLFWFNVLVLRSPFCKKEQCFNRSLEKWVMHPPNIYLIRNSRELLRRLCAWQARARSNAKRRLTNGRIRSHHHLSSHARMNRAPGVPSIAHVFKNVNNGTHCLAHYVVLG